MRITIVSALIVLGGAIAQAAITRAQEPSRPVGIDPVNEVVEVQVIAKDRQGRYIDDLKKGDFIVTDEGVEQNLLQFVPPQGPISVALLLDTSGCANEDGLAKLRQAALAMFETLRPSDKATVVSLNEPLTTTPGFTSDREALAQAVAGLKLSSTSHFYDVISVIAKQQLRLVRGPKVMILYSDGVDTSSRQTDEVEAVRAVEGSNVVVYSIHLDTSEVARRERGQSEAAGSDIKPETSPRSESERWPSDPPPTQGQRRFPWPFPSPDPNPDPGPGGTPTPYPDQAPSPFPDRHERTRPVPLPQQTPETIRKPRRPEADPHDPLDIELQRGERTLWDLSDRTGGMYFKAESTERLLSVLQQIHEDMRHVYMLEYSRPKTEEDGGYRRIRVRVQRPGVSLRARPGYHGF